MHSLSGKFDSGKIMNCFASTPSAFSVEDNSISRFSSSVVDSHGIDCSFIDLNLGRFGKDAQNSRILKGTAIASPSEQSRPLAPPKKARIGVNPQTAYCQVYGCNKDLSSSKEYHKRHKVCETHTKTAKVIVSGIEQRFCQQCSRFHLLAEFDDGKRSCRKRLAGHNERRRKPQVGSNSGKTGRLLHSYNGYARGQFHRTALTAPPSFVCQELLPGGLLHPEKYGTNDWCQNMKVENGIDFSSPSAITVTNGCLHSKSLFPHKLDKIFWTFDDNVANTAAGSIFSENTNHCPQYLGGQNPFSNSLVQSSSLGKEDLTGFGTASAIHGFSGIMESGCALSLLSSQSRKSSSNSSVIPMTQPLLVPDGVASNITHQGHVKPLGVGFEASTTGLSRGFSSSAISPMEGSHLVPTLISDRNFSVNFGITGGNYQGSNFATAKDHLSCEDGSTIDLFQVSSQLWRVEHQSQSMHAKQENALCWPRIN